MTKENITTSTFGRRQFLGTAAGGFTLAFFLPEVSRLGEMEAAGPSTQVNAWLQIGVDESITMTIGSSEMGQGSFSGLAQVLAEELSVDYAAVHTVQGSPSLAAAPPVGASINTVGSSVLRNNFWKMRDAGAAAREVLVQAAMNRRGDQTRANFTVALGVVTHTPSKTTYTYGSLAADAAKLKPLSTNIPLTKDADFKLIGKTVPRFDIPAKVDGSAKYGIDIQLKGMLYAVIKHCPTFGGTVAAVPSTPRSMKAVVVTTVAPGTGRGTEVDGARTRWQWLAPTPGIRGRRRAG